MNMNWLDPAWMAKQDEVQRVFIQWQIISKGQFSWKKAKELFIAGELDSETDSFSEQYKEAVRIRDLRLKEEKRIGKKIWSKGAPPTDRKKLEESRKQELTWVVVGEEKE